MKISGWGRFQEIEAEVSAPRSEVEVTKLVLNGNAIARQRSCLWR